MDKKINQWLDRLSNFLANRKGLPVLMGIFLVIANGILQFFPEVGWLVTSDLLLHVGIVIALFGVLLAWAL